MSACTQILMTNRHEIGFWARLTETVGVWRERLRQRRELARWTERDLRDVGVGWSDLIREAEKPFWRA